MHSPYIDTVALDVMREIAKLAAIPENNVQLRARIQVTVIDAIKRCLPFARNDLSEVVAAALWHAEYPTEPSWSEWVAYSVNHAQYRHSVDKYRRIALAVVDALPPKSRLNHLRSITDDK